MNFCYVLGSGSRWHDNEIRYSIRSVLKFHPDARIHIVGEKPGWYKGGHTYVSDDSDCPYVNQWHKLEQACKLFDEFIYMDDDFYLLKPFKKVHYSNGSFKDMKNKYLTGDSHWAKVIRATWEVTKEKNHCLHAPLPIISANFLTIAAQYPERYKAPSLVPRQIYCSHEANFEVVEKHDLKFSAMIDPGRLNGEPFFSIADHTKGLRMMLEKFYPEQSPLEEVAVITGSKELVDKYF